jgi:hypothetical protein
MMEHMRHTGKSGKFAVICGVVAAGLLVLTGMTLAEPVFVAFLGVLGLAYLAAVAEIVVRRRRFALVATGAGTALVLGFSLAFVSTWTLAYDDQSSFLGTPLPTHDPDNYFLGAGLAAVATFGVLFLGALWPGRRRATAARRPAGTGRRPASAPRQATRANAQGRARMASQRTSSQRPGPAAARSPRAAAPRAAGQASPGQTPGAETPGAQASPVQRTSASRTPARGPSAAGKRPSSSVSPAPKPVPRSGSGSASRR